MNKPSESMIEFFNALADLLDEHDVTIEATDEGSGYYAVVVGVQFDQGPEYDNGAEPSRPANHFNVGSHCDSDDLRAYGKAEK